MKRICLIAFLLSSIIFSCKKDNKLPEESNERKPEAIVNRITESLKTADSISNFVTAFKAIDLTTEETAEGITVFAPLNSEVNNQVAANNAVASVGSRKGLKTIAESQTTNQVLTESTLRDHIIKGVIKLSDLTDGKMLTALSGKQLKVTESNDLIWVNGVQIGGRQILSTDNEVVYTVKSGLSATTTADDPQTTSQEFFTALSDQENKIGIWHKNLVVADALLSHQTVVDSIPTAFRPYLQSFSGYNFQPSDAGVYKIWREGYQSIAALGSLIEQAPSNLTNRAENIGRIRALRAYIYLQLLSYYGNVPLMSQPGTLVNNNRAATINFITTELQASAAILPNNPVSKNSVSATTAKALEAKAALLEKNYTRVDVLTTAIISSGSHALADNAGKFSLSSSETLWVDANALNGDIKNFFMNRETLPYIRLTEVYLMAIEAALNIGQNTKAQNLYATLINRSGATPSDVSTSKLRQLWQIEMKREGHAFLNMLRWDTAMNELAMYGYTNKHSRLPIPQAVIDQNPGMIQNSGY